MLVGQGVCCRLTQLVGTSTTLTLQQAPQVKERYWCSSSEHSCCILGLASQRFGLSPGFGKAFEPARLITQGCQDVNTLVVNN